MTNPNAIRVSILIGFLSVAPSYWAQPAARAEFEVATVKRNLSGDGMSGMRPAGGRLTVTNMPLKILLTWAYQVRDFQILGGPGWINTERFDIEAKAEGDAANKPTEPAKLEAMLQTLLEDRFALKLHRETKELPIYTLVAAKGGFKLAQTKEGSCVTLDPTKPRPLSTGQPQSFCGTVMMGGGRLNAIKMSMPDFAKALSSLVGRTVVEKTGIAGGFDIQLRFSQAEAAVLNPALAGPDAAGAAADSDLPSVFTAVEEQLGLKLESGKGPVEVLVIDSVEQPSEN